jgi:molecular chaperone DnaK
VQDCARSAPIRQTPWAMGKVIGIDLGTTNSCVAVLEGGPTSRDYQHRGGQDHPSMVGFGKNNERLVGQLAKRQAVTNAENTVYSIKRFIGRRWDDTEVERSRVPYVPVSRGGIALWMCKFAIRCLLLRKFPP